MSQSLVDGVLGQFPNRLQWADSSRASAWLGRGHQQRKGQSFGSSPPQKAEPTIPRTCSQGSLPASVVPCFPQFASHQRGPSLRAPEGPRARSHLSSMRAPATSVGAGGAPLATSGASKHTGVGSLGDGAAACEVARSRQSSECRVARVDHPAETSVKTSCMRAADSVSALAVLAKLHWQVEGSSG